MLSFRHRRTEKHGMRSHGAHRARLQVEPLEDRSLPSVQVLATLGDPAAGPGDPAFLVNDFEPAGLNNHGEVLWGVDLTSVQGDPSFSFGEGIYLQNVEGGETRLARSGDTSPDGGTYDFGFFGPSSLNDEGDVAFSFLLSPFTLPFGVNAGTYRYSHSTQTVTAVVVPFVTPAPGGGVFQGSVFSPNINNRGDLLFAGLVLTDDGIQVPDEDNGLGEGVFQVDRQGNISSVVSPGDAAPGGGTFDFAAQPWNNDSGDVAFMGHVAGDPVSIPNFPPQTVFISALTNVYVKDGARGTITELAHAGDPIPASAGGNGVYRSVFGPQINNRGDVIFVADITPAPDAGQFAALFRYSQGETISIARPGDAMPGGGNLVTVSSINGSQAHVNNRGDIVFNGTLDTDEDGDQLPDQGIYQWSRGEVTLIARTGTVLPDVGTIRTLTAPAAIVIPPPPVFVPDGGAINNDRGQVLFSAGLTDGRTVLLLLTPEGGSLINGAQSLSVSGSAASLSSDLAFYLTEEPGPAFDGAVLQGAPRQSEPRASSPSSSQLAGPDNLVALEPESTSSTSHASPSAIAPFFALWADVLTPDVFSGRLL